MTRKLWIASLAVALVTAACGIDEQVHKKALDDLSKSQGSLQSCDEARQAAEADNAKLKEELAATGEARKGAEVQLASVKTDLQETASELKATSSELQELRKQREAAEKRLSAFRKLQTKLKSLTDTGKLKVSFRQGQMVLDLPAGVLFKSGRSKISKKGKDALSEVTDILLEFKDRRLMIAGHTDNQKIATKRFPNNWHLSTARAVSVLDFFIEQGFLPDNLAAAGYGEFAPVGDNESQEGRELNRRIEVIMVPDLSELPTLTEG